MSCESVNYESNAATVPDAASMAPDANQPPARAKLPPTRVVVVRRDGGDLRDRASK
jgi:hypothetical protein